MGDTNTIKSVGTSLRIVESLRELNGARVSEVAEALDMPASTVHSHFSTLREHGFVTKTGDIYHLGMKFLSLGEHIRSRSDAYQLAKIKVRQIADETDLRTHFIVEADGEGWYLYSISRDIKAYASVGKTAPLHATAGGKAILSELPRVRVEAIIDEHGLPRFTSETITDADELFDTLETARERGYTYNLEEHLNGICALGTPVVTESGDVVGAISVSGPVHQLRGERLETELPKLILGVSNELELNITYS